MRTPIRQGPYTLYANRWFGGVSFAVFLPRRCRIAQIGKKSRYHGIAHLRNTKREPSGILQRCTNCINFNIVDDDESIMANSAYRLRELAALLAERFEIALLKFSVGMRDKLDFHAAPAFRKDVERR